MGNWASAFNALSIFYMGIAAVTIFRLLRLGRAAFAAPLDPARARLLTAASFYVLTPLAVALHELGHAVAIWAFGGRVIDYHFMLYWGYVVPDRSFGRYGDFVVALAGNLVTLVLGSLAAWLVLRHPARAAFNALGASFAEVQLSMVLFLYPAFCLIGFGGDFLIIYNLRTAVVSGPLLVIHLLGAVLTWRAWRGEPGARLRLRASTLWDQVRENEAAALAAPSDPNPPLRLAWLYLRASLPAPAFAQSELALMLSPTFAPALALRGLAADKLARPEAPRLLTEALEALGSTRSEDSVNAALRAPLHLALARSELALGNGTEAFRHAALALAQAPASAEAAEVLGDAARLTNQEALALPALEKAALSENLGARREAEDLGRRVRRAR